MPRDNDVEGITVNEPGARRESDISAAGNRLSSTSTV